MLISIENHKNQQITNKQQKNSEIRSTLVSYINLNRNKRFTVTDLIKHCDVVKGKSHQYVASILRAAVSAGLIEKKVENYKTYFLPGRKN